MHSPRRSASRPMRPRPSRSSSQAGRSPPIMSPSRLASAQRASRPRPTAFSRHEAGAHHRLLEVQQAEIVFAAFADHHRGGASRRSRDAGGRARCRSGAAGCGCRWRSTPARRSSPPTARRAPHNPGSCRRRCRPRPARPWACPLPRAGQTLRRRRRHSRSGSAAPRRCWGPGRDHLRETQAGLAWLDRFAARRRGGRRLFPVGQQAPDVEAGRGPRLLGRLIDAEGGQHLGAPRPVAARHGERGVLEVGRGQCRQVLELADQGGGDAGQGREFVVTGEVERLAQAAHRGQQKVAGRTKA